MSPGVTKRPTTLSDRNLYGGAILLFILGMVVDAADVPIEVINALRCLVLFGGVYILVASVAIVRVYWRNFRIAPAHARLLPRHVIQLGLFVILLLVFMGAAVIHRVQEDEPGVWYSLPILMPAMFLGCFGLRDMLAWLPHRRVDLRATGTTDGADGPRRRSTDK